MSPGWHTALLHSSFVSFGIDAWQSLTGGFWQKRSVRRRWARRGWAWPWDVPAALRSPSQSSACGAWPGCAGGNEFSPVNTLPVQQWVLHISKDFLEWEGDPSLPPRRLCPLSSFRPCIWCSTVRCPLGLWHRPGNAFWEAEPSFSWKGSLTLKRGDRGPPMVPAAPAMAPRESVRPGGPQGQGQSWARGGTGQGRARAGLRARSQSPRNWGERREGPVPQGSGGARGGLSGSSSCCCIPGHGSPSSRLRFRCLHQPASPGNCRFCLRLKLAPGAGLAGSCSAP